MSANMSLKIRLGPLVSLEIEGDNCREVNEALEGFETLNKNIDAMCSDLAERIYPDGMDVGDNAEQEAQK